jgi:hypothetical protein
VATIDEVRARVQRFLQNNLSVVELHGDAFVVPYGSTYCRIFVRDWDNDDVLVKLLALVLGDVPLTDQVYKVVAERTSDYVFGNLSLNQPEGADNTVDLWFEHSLYGNTLDEPELMHALGVVVRATDELDDELQPILGGTRAREN